jgi:hypothetical protein
LIRRDTSQRVTPTTRYDPVRGECEAISEMSENPEKPQGRFEWRDNSWWVILSTTEMTLQDFAELSDDLLYDDLNPGGRLVPRRKRRRPRQL